MGKHLGSCVIFKVQAVIYFYYIPLLEGGFRTKYDTTVILTFDRCVNNREHRVKHIM